MKPSSKPLLILSVVFALLTAMLVWSTINMLQRERKTYTGDGKNVETYGFDLSTTLIPKDEIIASGFPKAGLDILDNPPFMMADEVIPLNEEIRGKYQVSQDLVVGVEINGDIRAYPIRVLNWHEVINDTVGGVPVAVTYNPFSNSVIVFDRRLDGETLELGVSGQIYNANSLLYDRRQDPAQESLWSQLQCRAVAGPAARDGKTLKVLPCAVSRWDDWKAKHPQSKVVKPEKRMIRTYQSDPYGSYQSSEVMEFSVSPEPQDNRLKKTQLLIVTIAEERIVIPYPTIEKNIDTSNEWHTTLAGRNAVIRYTKIPPTAQVEFTPPLGSEEYSVIYAYYFAWHAMHPGSQLVE